MTSSIGIWMKFAAEFALLVILLPAGRAQIQVPENVAVLDGSNVTLYYTTDVGLFYVTWLEYSTSPTGMLIFANGDFHYSGDPVKGARYSLEEEALPGDTNTLHTFLISGIQGEDAGMYETKEVFSNDERTAEVVVLGRDVECTIENEDSSLSANPMAAGERINVTCTVPYDGRWGPVVNCTGDRVSSWVALDDSQQGLTKWSYLGEVEGSIAVGSVICEAFFVNPTPSEYRVGAADNLIGYSSQWDSGNFDIYYPATYVNILGPMTVYDVGDVIMCEATGGNPAPTYSWVNGTNGTGQVELSSFQILTITSDMAGNSFNVMCTAATTIRGVAYQNYTLIDFMVNELPTTITPELTTPGGTDNTTTPVDDDDDDDEGGPTAMENELLIIIIVSVIAGVLALVLIIVLIVCCVKKGSSTVYCASHVTTTSGGKSFPVADDNVVSVIAVSMNSDRL